MKGSENGGKAPAVHGSEIGGKAPAECGKNLVEKWGHGKGIFGGARRDRKGPEQGALCAAEVITKWSARKEGERVFEREGEN